MNIRSLFVLGLLGLLAIFAVLNWQTFIAPTELRLLFTRVEAPLGLVMLGFVALLTVVFLGYVMYVQVGALAAGRRQSEELRHQRELADRAEASRFTELRQYLEQELQVLRQSQGESEARLKEELVAATNALSAAIGEVDERLERMAPTPPERQP